MVSLEKLREQILLEDLDEADLYRIGAVMQHIAVEKGTHIFRERDYAEGIYLISSGKVEISKRTPDGSKRTFAFLTSGHFFGELSILEKRLHEANAVALEDTTLLIIRKEDFETMEREDLVLASKIMKKLILVISRNLRRMNEKFLNILISP